MKRELSDSSDSEETIEKPAKHKQVEKIQYKSTSVILNPNDKNSTVLFILPEYYEIKKPIGIAVNRIWWLRSSGNGCR